MEKLLKYLKIMIKIFEIAAEWRMVYENYIPKKSNQLTYFLHDEKKTQTT